MDVKVNHPAAEIVAIALRKVQKLAAGKKHQQLLDACKDLLDNLPAVVAPHATREAAAGAAPQAPAEGSTWHEGGGTHESASNAPGSAHGGGSSMHAPTESSEQRLTEVASVKAHFETAPEDIVKATAEYNAADPTPEGVPLPATAEMELPTAASGPDAPAAPAPTAAPAPVPAVPSPPRPVGDDTVLSSGVTALDAVSAAATADLLPDIVQRTDTALPDSACARILSVLRLAVETDRPLIIEVALDCIQKLIAFKFLQGAAYAIDLEKQGVDASGESAPVGSRLMATWRTHSMHGLFRSPCTGFYRSPCGGFSCSPCTGFCPMQAGSHGGCSSGPCEAT
jgi:hypothetical protein